jgi:hypothetical protein
MSDCPDCTPEEDHPDLHAEDCPRVDTCGQLGPPYLPPPFHPWPDRPTMGSTTWLIEHAREVHGVENFEVRA